MAGTGAALSNVAGGTLIQHHGHHVILGMSGNWRGLGSVQQ
jgi:hypothetical protein